MWVYEVTQMTDFITSSSAYDENLNFANKKWIKDQSLHYPLNHTGILSIHYIKDQQ